MHRVKVEITIMCPGGEDHLDLEEIDVSLSRIGRIFKNDEHRDIGVWEGDTYTTVDYVFAKGD